MSHKLKMYIRNDSSHPLKSYSVSHTWNDHTNNLNGENLAISQLSRSQEITSGYNEHDWYTVQLTFADTDSSSKQTDFYCDSSHSEKVVTLYIHDDYLDCAYSEEIGDPDKHSSSCNKKHWT
ncbi:hypothetical protein [Pseudoalteromonas aliena]|uniref:hypothetical protein n=2 Tax=Pseudoalteromonas aliena TaxID=247523 RepID=UPI0012F8E95E|nr:hypothetical protein [Pseudoalteromonas aliena]